MYKRQALILPCLALVASPDAVSDIATIRCVLNTVGIAAPIATVASGAYIIEEHFVFSRSASGPDSAVCIEPGEFKGMVEAVRVTEHALGRRLRD